MRYWLILAVLILLIVGIIFYVTLDLQYRVLFNPSHEIFDDDRWPMNYSPRSIFLPLKGGRTNLWHFNCFGKDRPTILFCHGNSGNIYHRDYIINFCHLLSLNLVLFDYRGYGLSDGFATQTRICEDGMACYSYLRNQGVPPSSIIIWGESLGGAVATYIASNQPCGYLVLLCTFSSLDDIVAYQYNRPLAILVSLLIDTLPSKKRIGSVSCPVLILHSEDDEIIPFECAEIMLDKVSHPQKQLIPIHGTHAGPIITLDQLSSFLSFCNFDHSQVSPDLLQEWLNDLPEVARRHRLIK